MNPTLTSVEPDGRARWCTAAVSSCLLFTLLLAGDFWRRTEGLSAQQFIVTIGIVISRAMNLSGTAIPEKRSPTTGNDSTILTIEVRNVGSTTALFTTNVTTSTGGTFTGTALSNFIPGTYDITAKGLSHLRRKISSVVFTGGTINVDFSSGGTNKLLSGDVNGSGGDNIVNGIDLTLLVNGLTGSAEILDLNQDDRVNGIDLTNAVVNLTQQGDD